MMRTPQIQSKVYEYKLTAKSLAAEPISVKDSKEMYDFLIDNVYEKDTMSVFESSYAVFVDSSGNTKGFIKVSQGGVDSVIVDPKIVFSAALKCLASGIIFTHNHPSGSPKPSSIDDELTKRLAEAGKILTIKLIDHIVVGKDCYYSYNDHGRIER